MSDEPEQPQACYPLTPEERERLDDTQERARFTKIIQIGDMLFGEGAPLPDFSQAKSDRPSISMSREPVKVTLEQAREMLPFMFNLPKWLPDGFEIYHIQVTVPAMNDIEISEELKGKPVPSFDSYDLHVSWAHREKRYLHFSIDRPQLGTRFSFTQSVEPDSVTELTINGRPTALITQHRYFYMGTYESHVRNAPWLHWRQAGLHYQLHTHLEGLTVDELIRVAESIE